MYPAPAIITMPHGVSGEMTVGVDTSTTLPIRIYYALDEPGENNGWTLGPIVSNPGVYTISGLQNGRWYVFMAILKDSNDIYSMPSYLTKGYVYSAAPIYDIDLHRLPVEHYIVNGQTCYRLQIHTQNAQNMTDKIFLHHKVQQDPYSATLKDVFTSVCSPSDIEQFPEDGPTENEPPFYRLNYLDVVEDSLTKVEYFWESIKSDVLSLKIALEEGRRLSRILFTHLESGSEPRSSISSEIPSFSSASITSKISYSSHSIVPCTWDVGFWDTGRIWDCTSLSSTGGPFPSLSSIYSSSSLSAVSSSSSPYSSSSSI